MNHKAMFTSGGPPLASHVPIGIAVFDLRPDWSSRLMRVALVTSFAASRKEPLLAMIDRVHQGFLDAGLAEPIIRFNFGDAQIGGGVSSVDRVLKRHPELARFVTDAQPMPGIAAIAGARRISNGPMSAASGESIPYATLQAIAAGVPRSFPFHSIALHFYSPEFGELLLPTLTPSAGMMTGILVTDSWWVNGRNRSLSACTVVDAVPGQQEVAAPSVGGRHRAGRLRQGT